MKTARGHRVIDLVSLFFLGIFVVAGISSCEETCYDGELNQNEEAVDCGGPCVACDTSGGNCFDGILNQGEEEIDCGGPCAECIIDTSVYDPNYICEGNGGSSYFPLSLGSYWIYEQPSNQWFMYRITEVITLSNSEEYHHFLRTSSSGTSHFYLRSEGGQTYRWFADASGTPVGAEEIYIPSNPSTGQNWTTPTYDSIVISNANMSFQSTNGCDYDGILAITYYVGAIGQTDYFTQGVGMIQQGSNAILDSLVIF